LIFAIVSTTNIPNSLPHASEEASKQKYQGGHFWTPITPLRGQFCTPVHSSDWRNQIFINDAPTVEVDFQGMHLHLLASQAGETICGDPYTLPRNTVPGTPEKLQRQIIKTLLLKAINAKNRRSAYNSFREGWPTGHMAKHLTNTELSQVMDAIIDKHPFMKRKLSEDYGIHLMYLDSQISDQVLSRTTNLGIPVLGVHDSFIVDYRRVRALKLLMAMAATTIVGVDLPATSNFVGADEIPDLQAKAKQDYMLSRQIPRTRGYIQRLDDH
ncbi:hypothetical protein, partial [Aquicoccus porphyridii]|uniref:hypothetical protein n=1 Tax=Aquicoccus porphyridii TaxID=1852029 RepID=UPI00165D71DE